MDNAEKTSAWAQANSEGRAKGKSLIDRMVADENPAPLGWALKEMISKGEFGGVEVGFASEIAEYLITGSKNGFRTSGT